MPSDFLAVQKKNVFLLRDECANGIIMVLTLSSVLLSLFLSLFVIYLSRSVQRCEGRLRSRSARRGGRGDLSGRSITYFIAPAVGEREKGATLRAEGALAAPQSKASPRTPPSVPSERRPSALHAAYTGASEPSRLTFVMSAAVSRSCG